MARKSRVKSDKPVEFIADWEQADRLIREIADLKRRITAAEANAASEIDAVKKHLAMQLSPWQQRIGLYVRSLEAFATAHRAEFEGKSRKLNFGILGWRKSTRITITKKTLELIRQFFNRAEQEACIKVKESVDREALSKFSDEELADVEAGREVKDEVFVQPNQIEGADYSR